MERLRNAWMITKLEFIGIHVPLVWTVIFNLYIGGMSVPMLQGILGTKDGQTFGFFMDFYFLILIPMLGFFFSRKSARYLREDSYTKSLGRLRVLPVKLEEMILARILLLFIALIGNAILFFAIQYVFAASIRNLLSAGPFLVYAFTWIGYAFIVSALYIYMELGFKGKIYFYLSMLSMLLLVAVAVMVQALGSNVVLFTIEQAQRMNVVMPLAAIAIGLGSLALSYRLSRRKLQTRDLA